MYNAARLWVTPGPTLTDAARQFAATFGREINWFSWKGNKQLSAQFSLINGYLMYVITKCDMMYSVEPVQHITADQDVRLLLWRRAYERHGLWGVRNLS